MNMLWFPFSYPVLQTPVASLDGVISETIPLAAMIMPFLFVLGILAITFAKNYKNRKLQHETIRLMVEKGQPVPPELFVDKPDNNAKKHDDRKTGLILIALGFGLYFFFANVNNGVSNGMEWVGAIPLLIGVALLINWFLDRAEKESGSTDDKKN